MSEVAWAAGFFDGEGYTGLLRDGRSIRVRMSISQKDRRVLDRFADAVGVGRIYEYGEVFQWRTNRQEHVSRALEMLMPWLGDIKREQAQTALEQSNFHGGRAGEFDRSHAGHRISVRRQGKLRHCLTCDGALRGSEVLAAACLVRR